MSTNHIRYECFLCLQVPKHYHLTSFLSFCLRQKEGVVPVEVAALASEYQDKQLTDSEVNALSSRAGLTFKKVRDKGVQVT